MKSKRFEALAARPVNQDGYVQEWPEVGLIAMNSPFDPKPSIKIENGRIVEMDGKTRADFDMLDTFIADHAIRLGNAEKAMAMDSLDIARKIVDINVSRDEILDITLSVTPAKLTEIVGKLTSVEIMMGMTKMRARLMPANQCHVTNVKDNPVQIAADAAEAAASTISGSTQIPNFIPRPLIRLTRLTREPPSFFTFTCQSPSPEKSESRFPNHPSSSTIISTPRSFACLAMSSIFSPVKSK